MDARIAGTLGFLLQAFKQLIGSVGKALCLAFSALIAIASTHCIDADAAGFRTRNFIVEAPSAQLAESVGHAAEKYRSDLADYWLGGELPPWPSPCPVRVIAGPTLAAQGVTTYNRAPVRDFQMEVVGTPQRILDSVLPHEITHTVLATHFGRPLPRWADEGICTTVEHSVERNKHELKLREFLNTRRGIAMNKLFLLTEYPNDVLPMYAQGYSVCQFLIAQQDAKTFISFLEDYMRHPSWTKNVRKHYGYESLAELQTYWLAWVRQGSGPVNRFVKNTQPQSVALASGTANSAGNGQAVTQAGSQTPKQTNIPGVTGLVPADRRLASSALTPPQNRGPRDGRWNSTSGNRTSQTIDANQAVASTPTTTVAPIDGTNGTALASVSKDGWYKRKLKSEQSGSPMSANQATLAQSAIRPMAPPSVQTSGPYSVSQPQPTQRLGGRPSGYVFGRQSGTQPASRSLGSRAIGAQEIGGQLQGISQPGEPTTFRRKPRMSTDVLDGTPLNNSVLNINVLNWADGSPRFR